MAQTFTTCCKILFLSLVITSGVFAQSTPPQTDSDRAEKRALEGLRRREIPEATLPCTAYEARWWSDLRSAGAAVRSTIGGKKETKKFLGLLAEGQAQSYQPPIPDRGATLLDQVPLQSTEESRKKNISGELALVVELRPDGTVGEVKIVQGLGYGLDEKAAAAARRMIFLPAVKDRKFVSFRMPMTMSVATRRTYP
ncbi:MAG TPA: TonB family protein [Pyrinomonadaceae bacterium]|nr:TonB family protein [Pyrinomonadaceae bacterium]